MNIIISWYANMMSFKKINPVTWSEPGIVQCGRPRNFWAAIICVLDCAAGSLTYHLDETSRMGLDENGQQDQKEWSSSRSESRHIFLNVSISQSSIKTSKKETHKSLINFSKDLFFSRQNIAKTLKQKPNNCIISFLLFSLFLNVWYET
jgi:hypothetical protein